MITGGMFHVEFDGITYQVTPFIDGSLAGHKFVRMSDGATRYLYANPSTGGDSGPDSFMYEGETRDPDSDQAACWINVDFRSEVQS